MTVIRLLFLILSSFIYSIKILNGIILLSPITMIMCIAVDKRETYFFTGEVWREQAEISMELLLHIHSMGADADCGNGDTERVSWTEVQCPSDLQFVDSFGFLEVTSRYQWVLFSFRILWRVWKYLRKGKSIPFGFLDCYAARHVFFSAYGQHTYMT